METSSVAFIVTCFSLRAHRAECRKQKTETVHTDMDIVRDIMLHAWLDE